MYAVLNKCKHGMLSGWTDKTDLQTHRWMDKQKTNGGMDYTITIAVLSQDGDRYEW